MSTKPAPEIYHSPYRCVLCDREDYCVRVYFIREPGRIEICSACVAHMHGLYDELERNYLYTLLRNEVQA